MLSAIPESCMVTCRVSRFRFAIRVAKNDSHIALSNTSPTVPTEGRMPAGRQLPNATVMYCCYDRNDE